MSAISFQEASIRSEIPKERIHDLAGLGYFKIIQNPFAEMVDSDSFDTYLVNREKPVEKQEMIVKKKENGGNNMKTPDPECGERQKEIQEAGKNQPITDTGIKVSPVTDTPSNSTGLESGIKESLTTPPPRPPTPAPCTQLQGCPDLNYHCKNDRIRGRVCDVIGAPINQLPGNECPIERKERLKGTQPEGFHRANEDGFGNTFVKPKPYVIKPVPVGKEELIKAIRGYYTPKVLSAADDLIKSGQTDSDDYAELFEALIWEAVGRMV